jgi:hypothetical protein
LIQYYLSTVQQIHVNGKIELKTNSPANPGSLLTNKEEKLNNVIIA